MQQWYLSYDGQSIGPLDLAAAIAKVRQDRNGHCWRAGFAEWIPIASCAELTAESLPAAQAPPPTALRGTDTVDYTIHGEDMQFIEIGLDPGESVVAEAGAMMYKDATVQMETVFGDGSHAGQGGSFVDKLVSAGKRVITGETLFTTVFSNAGSGKARAAFAAPYPGTIIPLTLANFGQRLICQKDSFLCAARGVSLDLYFQNALAGARLDVRFNAVAGRSFRTDMGLIGSGGTVVLFGGAQRGSGAGPFATLRFVWDMGLVVPIFLMMRSKGIVGINMLKLGDHRPELVAECLQAVVHATAGGMLRPHVHATLPAKQLPSALRALGSGLTLGKVALSWADDPVQGSGTTSAR